jgi:thiamine-monophosphate kinase
MNRSTETDLIARYFAPLAAEGGLGLKDDAALLRPRPGFDLVLTADALVEGVHFLPEDPAASVASKALAVNVSDLAAKGAVPVGFLLSAALPGDWTDAWLAAFAEGLGRAARAFECPLLGGDTVRAAGGLTLSVTAIGEVPAGRMVHRMNARAGDILCVTGTIGDAALGLALRSVPPWSGSLEEAERGFLGDRYLHPQPRIALAGALREHARAAMDVSDGLVGDLAKMMRASGTSATVDLDKVPMSPAVRRAVAEEPALADLAMTGGDDYEILCAVPPGNLASLRREAEDLGLALAPIGIVTDGTSPPRFVEHAGERQFRSMSFSHF